MTAAPALGARLANAWLMPLLLVLALTWGASGEAWAAPSGGATPDAPLRAASPDPAGSKDKKTPSAVAPSPGGAGSGNPMFYEDRPSLQMRERLVFSVLACMFALYAFIWLGRQLLQKNEAAQPEASPPAAVSDAVAEVREPSRLEVIFGSLRPLHVFLAYLLVAIVVTFPAVFRLGTHVIGDNESDVWKHVWGHWWVAHSLHTDGVFPLSTDLINAPFGGSLYCIDPLNALISAPLQAVLPVTVIFNLLVMFQLALGAYAAYLLVSYVTECPPAAIPAGIIYAFCPFVMSYSVTSGVAETLNLAWPALSILFWLKCVREDSWSNPLRLGIFLFLTLFSCTYYGAFTLMLLGLLAFGGAAAWAFHLARTSGVARQETLRGGKAVGVRCLAGLALGAAMAFLPLYALQTTLRSPDSIIPPYVQDREEIRGAYMEPATQNQATLLSYISVGKENLMSTFSADRLSRSAYLGFIVLFWALIGLAGGRWARIAALLVVLFALLSIGPYLLISPTLHLQEPKSPLYLFLYNTVPVFKKIAIPYRFAVFVALFAGMLAAFGIRRILLPQPLWTQNLIAALISLQILIEFAVASPAPYPAPLASAAVPSFVKQMRPESGSFSVMDLPPTRWNTELQPGEYFYYQTVHRRPISYSVSGIFYQSMLANSFTKLLCRPHFQPPKGVAPPNSASVRMWLRENGYRYIVVHRRLLMPEDEQALRKVLDAALGQPAARGDGSSQLWVYTVEETPSTAAGLPVSL